MADTTTITCTEKTENVGTVSAGNILGVYTRTFTFPVLASATGYGATDILNLITIPANTQVLSIAAKASAAQSTGATFAFNITGAAAFGAAIALTTAEVFLPCVVTSTLAVTTGSDTVLQAVVGTNTCDAATITVTMTCCCLGKQIPNYTTNSI